VVFSTSIHELLLTNIKGVMMSYRYLMTILSLFAVNVQAVDSDIIAEFKALMNEGHIVLGVGAEATDSICLMRKTAAAISEQMDKTITIKAIPSKRLRKYVEQGTLHGDFSRSLEFQKLVPSALRVKTAIVELPFYAYGINVDDELVTDWDSLKQYKLAQPRGYSFIHKYLDDHDINFLSTERAAFGFVKAGRADLLVMDAKSASLLVAKFAPEYDDIKKVGSLLGSLSMHTYISAKYPELVEPYNEALVKVRALPNYEHLLSNEGCE